MTCFYPLFSSSLENVNHHKNSFSLGVHVLSNRPIRTCVKENKT